MSKKIWIAVILSGVIAFLYSVPWLALADLPRATFFKDEPRIAGARVVYLFATVFWTSILLFKINFYLKKVLSRSQRIVQIIIYASSHLVVVVIITFLLVLFSYVLFDVRAARAYFVFYLVRNVVLTAIVCLLTYVMELMEKLEKERMEVLLLESKSAESELSALRSQIDPHFIFNSLSTLSSLIAPANKQAIKFIEHLSDTFRYVLEKRTSKLVTVQEEVEFLKSYLYMMNSRFGDSIELTMDVANVETKMVPQFALQIAIENALKHNLINALNPLVIDISAENEKLIIRNNLQKSTQASGFGVGLTNLSKRYLLLSGKNIEMQLTENHFKLFLPLL